MRSIIVLSVLALFAFGCAGAKQNTEASGAAPAKPAETKSVSKAAEEGAAKVSCSLDADTRTLEVVAKGAGCDLQYTKAGKASSAATSAHGKKHCLDVQKQIRGKLEKSGFKCS